MATAKEKKAALEGWALHFPHLRSWKNQFLVKRNGGLVSGICLDETRDPKAYDPKFFFHNLLVPFPVMTIAYQAPLVLAGVAKRLRYGNPAEEVIHKFKEHLPLSQTGSLTFERFVEHVIAARHGAFGAQGVYLPHVFRDIITLGSAAGDAAYYRSTLGIAAAKLEATSGFNLAIIGSVHQWRKNVEAAIEQNHEAVAEEQRTALGLPELPDGGLLYQRVENFWECF
jgi:hypothetical protein